MVRKYIRNFLIAFLLLSGGWFFWHRSEIGSFDDAVTLLKKDSAYVVESIRNASLSKPEEKQRNRIRIAAFDLTDFDDQKLNRKSVSETLVQILARFDVIAIQGIQSADHDTLPRLMDFLRQVAPHHDYVIGPRSSHTAIHHQFAFIYNKKAVDLQRQQVYSIQDPDDIIAHDPLVGWFTALGPNPDSAFTFTLVNVRIDPTHREEEVRFLQKIRLAVKNDGRAEDDVILAGSFHQNSITLLEQKILPGYDFAITQDPTTLMGTRQVANLAFPVQGCTEFTGRAGVLDFLSVFNLTLDDAQTVSDHLPVWAEFFTTEGADPGYVASITR